ncbi:acyl-CoA dehydrogenase family protein, partial [Mycobacterium sp. 236(2023)]|uniref:acyl-CoA dehydrogenase family protein n=1 Tax=Mycobacterium sp. 236(2023) TaxID=3038163 RepID=UPI0024154D97
MDFTFTEEQETVGKVARQLFEARATPEHLAELEAGEVRYDDALWRELATSDLLGIALPEAVGGTGGGFLELGVLLSEVGWSVAPVPVYATLALGADTIARHGDSEIQQKYLPGVVDGSVILTAALAEAGNSNPARPRSTTARRDGDAWLVDGAKELVPAAQLARAIVVSALADDGPGLFVVDTDAAGVTVTPVQTTDGEPYAEVTFTGASARRLGGDGDTADIVGALYTRALVGLCAIQIGVTERAL